MSNTIEIKCQMGSRRRRFWTLRKMSKILEKLQKSKENVKSGQNMYIFLTRFNIFLHFPEGPKSMSPGPHLTFYFDCIGHFPETLQNRHFHFSC